MAFLRKELRTAIAAVTQASELTQKVFASLKAGNVNSAATVTKSDHSPVTVADFGSQAIINAILSSTFPKDPIVAEEDADELRKNPELRAKVWDLVSSITRDYSLKDDEVGAAEISSDEAMMSFIDKGNSKGGIKR
jgi:3'(2'), 5'-bisphosphate nucleotidase